jgi:4a-hydroxytetrahydrobiopterin dehydratase
MSDERLTARAFHDAEGVQDWRVLFGGAHAHFRTADLRQGAELVARIAEISAEVGLAPDVDVRSHGVTVRTCSRADGALGARDIQLARRVSQAAQELGLRPDPSQVQSVNIAVAQDAGADVRPFWNAVLGYRDLGPEDSADPNRRHPGLWFHELRPPKPGRGRVHIDVSVPADQIEARVAAAVAVGGRVVDDSHAPRTWTLASPDNHGIDLAAWPDVEDDDEW